MKKMRCVLIALVFLPMVLPAQQKKKHAVSAVFGNATYAWVEAEDGDAFSPNLLPEDRQAIADVEGAIRAWNRYHLVMRRSDAELVFIVRKGRLATAKLGAGIGNGAGYPGGRLPGNRPVGMGGSVGAEAGPPDDLLEVRILTPDHKLSSQLWMQTLDGGLDAPEVPLMRQLEKAVEQDYPRTPPNTPSKP